MCNLSKKESHRKSTDRDIVYNYLLNVRHVTYQLLTGNLPHLWFKHLIYYSPCKNPQR